MIRRPPRSPLFPYTTLFKRLDQKKVDREPDRPPPIRVAPEETGRGFGRLVVDPMLTAIHLEDVRVAAVESGDGTNAVRPEELLRVQHEAEQSWKVVALHDREEPLHATIRLLHHLHVLSEVGMVIDEPLHASLEPTEPVHDLRLNRLHREERDEPDHGAHFQVVVAIVRHVEHVLVEGGLVVPPAAPL